MAIGVWKEWNKEVLHACFTPLLHYLEKWYSIYWKESEASEAKNTNLEGKECGNKRKSGVGRGRCCVKKALNAWTIIKNEVTLWLEKKLYNEISRKHPLDHFGWTYRSPLVLAYRVAVLHHHYRHSLRYAVDEVIVLCAIHILLYNIYPGAISR